MIKRNPNLGKLQAGYLFPEINRRKKELLEREPNANIISLGIGNTTEALTPHITAGLIDAARSLGTLDGYSGYGDEQGSSELRAKIAEKLYPGIVSADEVFVSDGAKCDIGRLQVLFGKDATFAVQDPSYPVYVDGGVICGQTGGYIEKTSQFAGIQYMPCTPDNNFFPELPKERVDVIYFCSPNNPTGAVATKEQLKTLVDYALEQKSIIVFDSAYSMFIRDPNLPKSIFEIEGARQCAIEVNSFSKGAGFTGVRLGWSIVPEELKYSDGTPVAKDWVRVMTTIFNGASNLVQAGGIAALDDAGMQEMQELTDYYLANAETIRGALESIGMEIYGGGNSPYIWGRIHGKTSWEAFADLLEGAHVVTTPGSGFGPAGEGFIRFSAFGHKEDVIEASERLKKALG